MLRCVPLAVAVLTSACSPGAVPSASPTTASPTVATATRYVALGDSYSAGTGTDAPTDDCYQSRYAYPVLVAASTGWSLDQHACQSATIADITSTQLPAVDASDQVVSVTAGGNDAGFRTGLEECALPGWMGSCPAHLEQAAALVQSTIPARLGGLYADIAGRAPRSRRVAVLYPHIFQGDDCAALTFFSPAEQRRINQLTDQLDDAAAALARAHGMLVVDPRNQFTGHAWCDTQEWINGPALPVGDSYHPNRAGNRAYANLVLDALGQRTPSVSTAAAPSSTPPVAQTSAQIRQVAPGLASPTNLRRGSQAGLDQTQLVAIDRGLRSHDLATQRRALSQLHVLERRWERTHR